jgi:hypothetical protein
MKKTKDMVRADWFDAFKEKRWLGKPSRDILRYLQSRLDEQYEQTEGASSLVEWGLCSKDEDVRHIFSLMQQHMYTAEQIERGLQDPNTFVRATFLRYNRYTMTPEQVERATRDESPYVLGALLEREGVSFNAEQWGRLWERAINEPQRATHLLTSVLDREDLPDSIFCLVLESDRAVMEEAAMSPSLTRERGMQIWNRAKEWDGLMDVESELLQRSIRDLLIENETFRELPEECIREVRDEFKILANEYRKVSEGRDVPHRLDVLIEQMKLLLEIRNVLPTQWEEEQLNFLAAPYMHGLKPLLVEKASEWRSRREAQALNKTFGVSEVKKRKTL